MNKGNVPYKFGLQLQIGCMRSGLQTSPLGYKGVNLRAITPTQRVFKT
jgi:hypothetical protein